MAAPVVTITGNLTEDPTLRFTSNGNAVANVTIANTPKYFDKQANEWRDKDTIFMRGSIWGKDAENVVESLSKGTRVIAEGRMEARDWEDRDGNKRTSWELTIDEIGPSLKYATAKVTKVQRDQQNQPAQSQNDPWGTSQPSNAPRSAGSGDNAAQQAYVQNAVAGGGVWNGVDQGGGSSAPF